MGLLSKQEVTGSIPGDSNRFCLKGLDRCSLTTFDYHVISVDSIIINKIVGLYVYVKEM